MDHYETKNKSIQTQSMRFTFQFSGADSEALEWFHLQKHKGAYLKALILADKARRENSGEELSLVTRRNRLDAEWHEHFEQLQNFVAAYGRLPASAEQYGGFCLGRWLNSQQKKKDTLPQEKRALLDQLGALDDKWEQTYRLVKAFLDTFGRLPEKHETFHGVRVGRWLETQKKRYAETECPRAEQLNAIGVLQTKWERNFAVLQAFAAEHGRLPKYIDRRGDAQIGRWLNYQCKTLDPDMFPARAKKLWSLGAKLKKGDPPMETQMLHTDSQTQTPPERCVLCHKLTDVPSNMPIEQRQGYVVGCGQLCADCLKKIK